MKIREIDIKNFGKLNDKNFKFDNGINIIYGENESGKSTIHTFIRSMLYGMERGRGRAANTDTFRQYEPWENPNFYSGTLKLESGGKIFCIQRNFDKYAKSVSLICQDDGEELSVENGDLEMLLDDMDESVYDNTVSVGQIKAEPTQSLSAALKNYATNCYTSGDGELDQNGAMEFLKKRKKEIQKEIDLESQKIRGKRDQLELEVSYVWRDIQKFQEELDEIEKEIGVKQEKEIKEESQKTTKRWRVHPMLFLLFTAMILFPFMIIPRPWNYLVAITIFLFCGNFVWSRLKVSKKQVKTESEKILEEISGESETLEKLLWERGRVLAEQREKQVLYDNLKEQLEELKIPGDVFLINEKKKLAIAMAEEQIQRLASSMQERLKKTLNENASKILGEITGQKYTHINIEETLKMTVLSEGRAVNIERLSRGTLEQIYFAVRMAAADVLQNEELPVILDDTFVHYDDNRLASTLRWLIENKEQVLIFTCQKREEDTLQKMGVKYKTWQIS